ncbi:MAG: ATP:cob(I)alamin adenosyltransferase, partial [Muribaculaceae bacterium]|nr:ATP:cob(I)alamin adenosyltransferase [Muribaculaceae bacterium]
MKKSPIYTRTGDKGMTSLVDGTRLAKNSVRIEAYGTVDELNSFVGVLIATEPLTGYDRELLTDIQARLFDIGSYLASGNAEMSERLTPSLDGSLEALEHAIDLYDSEVPQLRSFV